MAVNLKNIEEKVKPIAGKTIYDKEFIFDLLAAYGRSPVNITRLRNGQFNIANDKKVEVAQKNIVYFKPTTDSVYAVIDDLKTNPTVIRYSTRFVIVTDYKKLLAIDTKTNETLDIDIDQIGKHYTFFLPWAGMEKAQFVGENHADVKAAEKMAKLFDEIVASNDTGDANYYHNLNVFFTRILFCFFAEDTGIFKKDQFTNAIGSYTQKDGSDVSAFLQELFTSLDIEDKTGYASHVAAFPYVNGKLFHTTFPVPEFNHKARDLILQCGGELDWSDINPDIFGSMIQAVVNPGQRAGLGMHYTSVPNIMKTIDPLFLDELKDEINKRWDSASQLEKILSRLGKIKVFDPASGSGNFLIIAYKELRLLEHTILERQGELGTTNASLLGSRINIENFYGIEIDDFAHEVAILSLWLAKHQMNLEFAKKFGIDLPLIPLKEAGNIAHGNAARTDWNRVCPNDGESEIYLISNPPYLGSKLQDSSQKKDYDYVFGDELYSKNLDYIALWFIKGAHYIANTKAQLAFVTTNSVAQGEHVGLMFPKIFKLGLEIGFSYVSFKWGNNAKRNAGVTVSVISLRNESTKPKTIFSGGIEMEVENINGYLVDAPSTVNIERRSRQISGLPEINFGSMPIDGGGLVLDKVARDIVISQGGGKYIKKLTGAEELIKGLDRWCLWIEDSEADSAKHIPYIAQRLSDVASMRSSSKRKETVKLAETPHRFGFISYQSTSAVMIPGHSSEKRSYIPIGYLDKNTVITNSAFAIYDASPYVFGLVTSRMHMAWTNATAGKLETRIRYSAGIVYNNFPVPPLTVREKELIEEKVFGVLDARESHSEKTLAQMYDQDKMPDDLYLAHQELDDVVDGIYRKQPFENDEERLAHLFDLYEKMTAAEKEKK